MLKFTDVFLSLTPFVLHTNCEMSVNYKLCLPYRHYNMGFECVSTDLVV